MYNNKFWKAELFYSFVEAVLNTRDSRQSSEKLSKVPSFCNKKDWPRKIVLNLFHPRDGGVICEVFVSNIIRSWTVNHNSQALTGLKSLALTQLLNILTFLKPARLFCIILIYDGWGISGAGWLVRNWNAFESLDSVCFCLFRITYVDTWFHKNNNDENEMKINY